MLCGSPWVGRNARVEPYPNKKRTRKGWYIRGRCNARLLIANPCPRSPERNKSIRRGMFDGLAWSVKFQLKLITIRPTNCSATPDRNNLPFPTLQDVREVSVKDLTI